MMLGQMAVIAAVTDPDEGIWRGIDAALWLRSYDETSTSLDEESTTVRRDVMALGSALSTPDPRLRKALWIQVFPRLHHALMGTGTPIGCERTLAAVLPDGPSWDWCGRLRFALARTAVVDDWSRTEVERVARGAGSFAPEVVAATEAFRRKESRSLVDGVVDFITRWWH
jgi:hypothetical protein